MSNEKPLPDFSKAPIDKYTGAVKCGSWCEYFNYTQIDGQYCKYANKYTKTPFCLVWLRLTLKS